MDTILNLMVKYGEGLLALLVFLEAIGLPLPAAPALLACGAAAALGLLAPGKAFGVALLAMLTGDLLLYLLGRTTGWWLLGILCRVSMNPETCIYASAARFQKRGRAALVLAKFIPGVNTMAAPIAGSMNMHPATFLAYDMLGALLYVGSYYWVGFLFHGAIAAIADTIATLGRGVIALLVAYVAWKFWKTRKKRGELDAPGLDPAELSDRMDATSVILDVRSHGYYDATSKRIAGARRLEPNDLPAALAGIDPTQDVFVYCTCYQDATAKKVAKMMRENGFNAMYVRGGLTAWEKHGLAVEQVPEEDIIVMPKFR